MALLEHVVAVEEKTLPIKLWDTATGACGRTLEDHGDGVKSIGFSVNGKQLASGSYDKTIKLWDTATGAYERTLKGYSGTVTSVAFLPTASQLASGSYDSTIKLGYSYERMQKNH